MLANCWGVWINIGFPTMFSTANEECFEKGPLLRSKLKIDVVLGAVNSIYRPAQAILMVTNQNASRHNVKTVHPIIKTLI